MSFSPNKTPIQIIKEGAFDGTYFRDVYSGKKIVGRFRGKLVKMIKNSGSKYDDY